MGSSTSTNKRSKFDRFAEGYSNFVEEYQGRILFVAAVAGAAYLGARHGAQHGLRNVQIQMVLQGGE